MTDKDKFLAGQGLQSQRINDLIDKTEVLKGNKSLSDYLNVELILSEITWKQGNFGEFAVLTVANQDDQIDFQVNTGSAPVLKQLRAIDDGDNLPMLIRAVKVEGTRQLILE